MAGYGVGASLASMGLNEQKVGIDEIAAASSQDAQRQAENTQMKSQARAGNMEMGAGAGAMAGFAIGGPWGAVIGGLVGAVGGSLFN
jgi:hypothetical protein